jgi:sterol desaturase/sphingolipid hydroxylase (fatty acid hydroxylase superfamily)
MPSLDIGSYFVWLLVVSTFCLLLERLWPWRRSQAFLRRGFAQDLFWLIFNGHFAAVLLALPAAWLVSTIYRALGLVHIPEPETIQLLETAPLLVQLLVILVVKDFFEWSIHNLLHRVPWLWEFHKVHHTIRELDWIGNFRFHWMEIVVYRSLTYFPLALLGIDGRILLANAVIGTLIGHLNHSNLRLDYGPLRYVLNSPRFHVWHHDRILRGTNGTNFAIVLSVWDWIFKTAYLPTDREQPDELGFDGDDRFPTSLIGRITYPVSGWLRRS